MLNPKTVAVLGASENPTKWGSRAVKALSKFGFTGSIYPVNPHATSILGLKCYASVSAVPEQIDLALISLPAKLVPHALRELGNHGAKTATVFSAGFGESGEAGRAVETEMRAALIETGIRLCGPSSLGMINLAGGVAASASSALALDNFPIEPISVVSQSGAIGLGTVLNRGYDHGIGFRCLVSTGSELDLELADFVQYFAEDPGTNVICLYAEGFRNGPRLLAALATANQKKKPVVALFAGHSAIGRRVSVSHTGLLAQDEAVIGGLCRQFNVIRATDPDDLFEKGASLSRTEPTGGRVGVVSLSGGMAAILADVIATTSLTLPVLDATTKSILNTYLADFNTASNPLDLSGQLILGDATPGFRCLSAVMADPNVDVCLLVLTVMNLDPLVDRLLSEDFRPAKPLFILFAGGSLQGLAIARLEGSRRYPVFWRSDKCISAIRDCVEYHQASIATTYRAPADIWLRRQSDPRFVTAGPTVTLSETESAALLSEVGVGTPKSRLVSSLEMALEAAQALGYPVCLKVHGRGIPHKSDLGGVFVPVTSEDALTNAFEALSEVWRIHGLPHEALIQEAITGGTEVLIGASWQPRLGAVVSVGVGGTEVGRWAPVSFRVAPVDTHDVEEMLLESGVDSILARARLHPLMDRAGLIRMALGVSRLITSMPTLREIEMNPVLVRQVGQGAIALDCLAIMDSQ